MAKVPFSKLQAAVDGCSVKTFYYDKSGNEVYYEVKHYLPFKEKLEMITRIVNQSVDDNGFYNPMRVQLYTVLEVMYAYTNLSFTEKQKEDLANLYDILESNGIIVDIIASIPEEEYSYLVKNVDILKKEMNIFESSFAGTVNNFMTQMPVNAQAAADIVENFNPEKYEEVINFARGIGMQV